MDITVTDSPARHRYEARAAGELAGFVQYRLEDGVITLVHTEVKPAHESKGVGGALIRGTLNDIRERGLAVVPTCPFARSWIERHPDYADLVRR